MGLVATSSKRTYATPTPRALFLWQATAHPSLHRRCSNTVCLHLCGVPGSWCAQGLLEPSERLWRERDLILNANSPILLSYWGFSFALRHGVSPLISPAHIPDMKQLAEGKVSKHIEQKSCSQGAEPGTVRWTPQGPPRSAEEDNSSFQAEEKLC